MADNFIIKDSGSHRTFDTGAIRDDDSEKLRLELIHWILLERLGRLMGKGAKKYGANNWQKGIPDEVYKASLQRHVHAVIKDLQDEDHLAAVAFNVMGLMYNHLDEYINNKEGS